MRILGIHTFSICYVFKSIWQLVQPKYLCIFHKLTSRHHFSTTEVLFKEWLLSYHTCTKETKMHKKCSRNLWLQEKVKSTGGYLPYAVWLNMQTNCCQYFLACLMIRWWFSTYSFRPRLKSIHLARGTQWVNNRDSKAAFNGWTFSDRKFNSKFKIHPGSFTRPFDCGGALNT